MIDSNEQSDNRIDGLAAAALLAAGFGPFILGLLTTLSETSTGINDFLKFNDRVGPLAGKTLLGTAAYFAVLVVFGTLWVRRPLPLRPVLWAAFILFVLGLLGTFPTFFQAFE